MASAAPPTAAGSRVPAIPHLNSCAWLLDRRIEAGDGDRVALRCAGVDHTYADVASMVASVAEALRVSGVRREERVLLLLPDTPELVACLLGAMHIGAVPVPLSTMATADDLAFIASDSGARLAVVHARFGAAAVGLTRGDALAGMVVVGDPAAVPVPAGLAVESYVEWAQPATGPVAVAPTTAESPAFWLYTSGTTGSPKAAMHRHADMPFTAESYAAQVLGIRRDDRCLSIAKLFFAYGLGNSLTFPFSAGAATVLNPDPPTPASIAALVHSEQPTLFFATPTFYAGLLAADLPPDTFASVRQGVSAGEPLPASVFERFRDRFGVEILDGIGSTEALHIFLSNRPGAVRPGTSGTPVPGYEVRIVDDSGDEVTLGDTGHLLVRGESLATGYWCRTALNRRTFLGEWMRTGDVYTRSDDGVYTYCGRSDDMLKAGGIWVSPAEVESALVAHPSVVEAAVVGRADADDIVRPVAYVVLRADATADESTLITFCRESLAPFKRPREVIFVAELPKTATGKIQRYKLRG